jgi:ABC-type nitrate/sulfonate/bicarbonate transport system permease component
LQLGRLAFLSPKIGLPNAMPDILSGMRLSMTVALIVAVVGEMLASQTGWVRRSCWRHALSRQRTVCGHRAARRALASPATRRWRWLNTVY